MIEGNRLTLCYFYQTIDVASRVDGCMKRREALQAASIGCFVGISGCQDTFKTSKGDNSNPQHTNTSDGSVPDGQNNPDSSELGEIRITNQGDGVVAKNAESGEVLFEENKAGVGIQAAIDEIDDGGTVVIEQGTYVVNKTVLLESDMSLIGSGANKPVLKLADGLNENAVSVLRVGVGVTDATIRNLEIDGNESNNREIEPFPESPHSHGLIIHGNGEGEKPKRITVNDVYSHDAVRSNVVLGGVNCTLKNLELENAATDHWLYLARAESCELSNIDASGFTRGGGIVFGTPGYQCSQNTVSDVIISDAKKPPHATLEDDKQISRDWPLPVCVFRSDGDGYENTLKNIQIEEPADDLSHRVVVTQPETTIENLDFTGPVGYTWSVLQLGDTKEDANIAGTVIDSATFEITDHAGPQTNPYIVASFSSDVTISNCDINGRGKSYPGALISGEARPVRNNTFKNVSMRTGEPALTVDGTNNPVTELSISEFADVNSSGTEIHGEVSFDERDINN